MRGTLNGSSLNEYLLNGSGYEGILFAEMSVTLADAGIVAFGGALDLADLSQLASTSMSSDGTVGVVGVGSGISSTLQTLDATVGVVAQSSNSQSDAGFAADGVSSVSADFDHTVATTGSADGVTLIAVEHDVTVDAFAPTMDGVVTLVGGASVTPAAIYVQGEGWVSVAAQADVMLASDTLTFLAYPMIVTHRPYGDTSPHATSGSLSAHATGGALVRH